MGRKMANDSANLFSYSVATHGPRKQRVVSNAVPKVCEGSGSPVAAINSYKNSHDYAPLHASLPAPAGTFDLR